MKTPTLTRTPAPSDTFRLTLHAGSTSYSVRVLAADTGTGLTALVRLRKSDGTTYHVARTADGATCECGSFIWHHDGRDLDGCKHIRACRSVGLI